MTVNEFERYFKLGHGKAITLLREEPDKKQFQRAFLELIKTNLFQWKEKYAVQIMHILRMKDKEFANELETQLIEMIRHGNGIAYALLESLSGEKAQELMKGFYKESYKLLKDWFESGKPTEGAEYDSIYSKYSSYCEALGRGQDQYFILPKLMKENADLYLISDKLKSAGCSPLLEIFHFGDQFDDCGEWFKQLFDKTLKDHPAYEIVKEIVFRFEPKPSTKEYKTVEDFHNLDFENFDYSEYHNLQISLSKAHPETFRKLAELTLREPNLHKKSFLMSFFIQEHFFGGVMPEFPLSPEPLMDIVNEYLEKPTIGVINTYEDSDLMSYFATCLLSEMQNASAKEFCLSLFTNESLNIDMRNSALITLIKNYTSDDEKLIREIYPTYYFKDNAITILYKLSEKGVADAPYDILFDTYEKEEMHRRLSSVLALINRGLITDEMLNECTYDENSEVIKAAKKEINKRIMERRNNKANNGWNEIKSQEDIDFLLQHTCAFHDAGLVNFEYNPKEAKESPTYIPSPLMLRFDLFFYDDAYSSLMGLEMLCEEVEHFNFHFGVDIITMFFAATFKFYEKSILWGADPGPAQETNKYGFADDEVWIKCKRIKWRLCETFKEEK